MAPPTLAYVASIAIALILVGITVSLARKRTHRLPLKISIPLGLLTAIACCSLLTTTVTQTIIPTTTIAGIMGAAITWVSAKRLVTTIANTLLFAVITLGSAILYDELSADPYAGLAHFFLLFTGTGAMAVTSLMATIIPRDQQPKP